MLQPIQNETYFRVRVRGTPTRNVFAMVFATHMIVRSDDFACMARRELNSAGAHLSCATCLSTSAGVMYVHETLDEDSRDFELFRT